jgi:hypothetical protein
MKVSGHACASESIWTVCGRCGEEQPGCSARSQSNASYAKFNKGLRFDVLTSMTTKIAVFCDKVRCNVADRSQRLTETAALMFGEKIVMNLH